MVPHFIDGRLKEFYADINYINCNTTTNIAIDRIQEVVVALPWPRHFSWLPHRFAGVIIDKKHDSRVKLVVLIVASHSHRHRAVCVALDALDANTI